jgi:type II secretory pathway pseudopilin PulG
MIVISIIGVLAAIAIPNFRAARQRSNQRACYANQKTILGAVEMYNLDTGQQAVIPGVVTLEVLATKRYLQTPPDCPGCKDTADSYNSDVVGNVWCKTHGTIDGTCIDGGAGCVAVGAAGADGMGACG